MGPRGEKRHRGVSCPEKRHRGYLPLEKCHRGSFHAISSAIFTALSSAKSAGVSFALGDKGDGTPAGVEDARRRHAHLNATHIPDIIRYGSNIVLYEYKCYSIFLTGGAQGNGSSRLGGAASEVEGWLFAFGREEALHTRVLGHAARGDDGDDIFDRLTGVGRLTLKRGDYSDAADKGYLTYLLVTEPTGACNSELADPPAPRHL